MRDSPEANKLKVQCGECCWLERHSLLSFLFLLFFPTKEELFIEINMSFRENAIRKMLPKVRIIKTNWKFLLSLTQKTTMNAMNEQKKYLLILKVKNHSVSKPSSVLFCFFFLLILYIFWRHTFASMWLMKFTLL